MHIYIRGTRKMPIFLDDEDRWMFLDSVYRANRRDLEPMKRGSLFLPNRAPIGEPMVEILAFCLLENHFHLQIRVKNAADASKFMQRLCGGVTKRWHKKTGHSGRLFEATYRRKIIKDEYQARVLFAYISVKNAAEASGINLETASSGELVTGALGYKFSSLPDYYLRRNLPIVEKSHFLERFPSLAALEEFVSERPKTKSQKRAWRQFPLKLPPNNVRR